MKQDKLLSLLGLAKRAGKIQSGAFLAEKSVRSGRARLVIVASDASGNTKKRFMDKCAFRHIPVHIYAGKEMLGAAIGEEARSVVSVEDEGFAEALGSIAQGLQENAE